MSSNSSKRAPTTATQRLKQDYFRIKKDPVPCICAEPIPPNILDCHYVVRGPEMTPYEGGCYHGKLMFPREFPFKPPSIYMITPNGRFKCNTRLCISITDFHPDTWNPVWSVFTILTGLPSFMFEKGPTLGMFNSKDKVFCELFPEVNAQGELSCRPQNLPLSSMGMHLLPGRTSLGSYRPTGIMDSLSGALANLFVIVGFAAFAYTVKYVLRSIAQE
uniref:UBC core domain-containing protein n=1 Tax=Cricetulus griseus TaxID=10029 RepID=A0A8C2M4Q9_CRIGR